MCASCVQVRVALGDAADLVDQLQPPLGVARLVLHHRRVVELRLGIGRDVQELRGHLAGEHVGLELLREDGAPHVASARAALRRALALGDRRELVPGQVAHLPLLALGELVEAQDACVLLALARYLIDDLLHVAMSRRLSSLPVELRKWPRKNDAASIRGAAGRARRAGWTQEVFGLDVTPWVDAQEALTGSLGDADRGDRAADDLARRLRADRAGRGARRALAGRRDEVSFRSRTRKGRSPDSLYRGARAAAESGGFRTEVLRDRITRASAFVTRSAEEAVALRPVDRGRAAEDARVARRSRRGVDLPVREAARGRDVRRGARSATCMWAFTTGDACGPNMMTRNAYALNMGYVHGARAAGKPERAILEANMGGDKKPSRTATSSAAGTGRRSSPR